jgi:hypothetical protein
MYNFTFKTDNDLHVAQQCGYIESYDCVRVTIPTSNGTVNFPVKTLEDFQTLVKEHPVNTYQVEQTTHSYDRCDYEEDYSYLD